MPCACLWWGEGPKGLCVWVEGITLAVAELGALDKNPFNGARTFLSHNIPLDTCRSAFVAPPGFVLLSADYRQIELRMMAHLSRDEGLCSLLCQTQTDPFRMLAAKWLRLEPDQV
jgi:DNA polymerase family A